MFNDLPPSQRRPDYVVALTAAIPITVLVFGLGGGAFVYLAPLEIWYRDQPVPIPASSLFQYLGELIRSDLGAWIASQIDAETIARRFRPTTIPILTQYDGAADAYARMALLGGTSLMSGLVTFIAVARSRAHVDDLRHISGPMLADGSDANARAQEDPENIEDIKRSGQGIAIAPGVRISRDREARGILHLGSPGSGKTQLMTGILDQVILDDDRVLAADLKGDYTAKWPTDDFVLLAPSDARTWAWDIARDCDTRQKADELARALIPPTGDDGQWAEGGAAILAGLMIHLQMRQPGAWSWNDLLALVLTPPKHMRAILERSNDVAVLYLPLDPDGTPTRTAESYRSVMASAASKLIKPLATAWKDIPPERRFSFSEWILTPDTQRRHVLLRFDGRYKDLSDRMIAGCLAIVADTVASPAGNKIKSRCWFVVDELSEFQAALRSIERLKDLGREAGMRAVLGTQTLQQLDDPKQPGRLSGMMGSIGTTIICKQNHGPAERWLMEKVVPSRTIERPLDHPGKDGNPGHRSWQRQQQSILPDGYLVTDLGPSGRKPPRITAVLLGLQNVYRLTWPVSDWKELRPRYEPNPNMENPPHQQGS